VQNRIRELCRQLRDATNANDVERIGAELQQAIHEHIDSLRLSLADLTVLPSERSKKAA